MNKKLLLLPMMALLLLLPSVMAASGVIVGTYNESTGDWNATHTASLGIDYNETTYALCEGNCSVSSTYYVTDYDSYSSVILNNNLSGTTEGIEMAAYEQCVDNDDGFLKVNVTIHSEVGVTNTTIYCQNISDLAWLTLFEGNFSSPNTLSQQYLYYTDPSPVVTIELPVNNFEKPCSTYVDDQTLDVVFYYNDSTDTNASCSLYINDVLQATNNSVVNFTSTTLTGTVVDNANNTVYVTCTDNSGTGTSNTVGVIIEDCIDCVSDFSNSFLVFAVVTMLLFGIVLGSNMKKYAWLVILLGAAGYGLWFLISVIGGTVC